uniref:Phage associated protein n=1 Tax=Dulem virus 50 TaxID=3145761 RepID=A0AAU8B2W8_9VIRU
MSRYQQKFIVQELENHEFIYPDPFGDIGFTSNIKSAGHYDSYEDAFNAAMEEIGGEFLIFGFYLKEE